MLLVVALHAAPTGGQAPTRLVGSAFDPTTTSVALSPKRANTLVAAKEIRRDPSSRPGMDAPAISRGAAVAHPAFESFPHAAPAQPYAVAALPERRLTRPVGTRAPPAA